jgi:hypothetical protein
MHEPEPTHITQIKHGQGDRYDVPLMPCLVPNRGHDAHCPFLLLEPALE